MKRVKNIRGRMTHDSSSLDRGVVSRGKEHEKSRDLLLIGSEMAGPIWVKLSGIHWGNRRHILGQKK